MHLINKLKGLFWVMDFVNNLGS